MKYIIPKGWHFSLPWIPRIYWKKDDYAWSVMFTDSCKYDHGTDDQLDWNKLVGVTNQLNPRKDSLRIVWRYNKETDLFEIAVYVEKNNVFKSTLLASAKSNELFQINLKCYKTYALVETKQKLHIADFQSKSFTIRLNPYFGGNLPAPHKMILKLNND